jgi:hypothetical protein
MADKKISALTGATTPLDGTEVLPIVQSGATVKVANNDLRPKQIQSNATSGVLQVAGPAASSTRVMTTPDANFTVARTDAAQSFTGDQTLSTGNLVIGTSGKGIAGTTTNDNADGGVVGQFVASSVATATLTSAAADIASISLTAGDWDVTYIASSGGVSATCTAVLLSINTTSATVGTQVDDNIWVTADPINGLVGGVFTKRLSLSATTTVYGISRTVAGTVSVFQAKITARRRR